MSGEDSKNSGELGEKIVASFLKLIGWATSQSGLSLICTEPKKHNKTENGNASHGIDELYSYESPMDANSLVHAVISVKHTKNRYPLYPNAPFKNHVADLANTVECFKESALITDNREGFEATSEQVIGILFWLSSEDDRDFSIISKIKNPVLKDDLSFERIQVMDNDRVEFISKSIDFIKGRFIDYSFSFYYIDTPNNLSDTAKKYDGDVLPIEMLSSDIQLFKLEKGNEIILAIFVKDKFHTDGLKRMLGLAHRISNNLTSNVQIFYPCFAHEEQNNKNAINRIKNQFKDLGFINSTYVYGYDIGFKDTEVIESILTSIPSNEPIDEQKLDDGKILPYGEHLRSLLSHSIISESELKNLLREKGVYVCDPKKEQTIPILTSLLLSPKEFDYLKEKQSTNEDKEKRLSSRFKTVEKPTVDSLKKALKSLDLNKMDKNKFRNYQYRTPIVTYQVDKEKNQLIVDYKIERYQRNKSWDEQISSFKGSVILDCNGKDLEMITKSIHTSAETLGINQLILNHTKDQLVEANIISKSTKEEKILIGGMNNEETIQFILSFTDNRVLTDIEFVDIISIEIEIDDTVSLPETSKIKWMESKIKNLRFDGKKIEDVEILTDKSNHKYLKCWGIVAEYKFDNLKAKGTTNIELKFNIKNKGEFFIQTGKHKFDKQLYTQKNIDEMILSEIDSIKHNKHKEIMEKSE